MGEGFEKREKVEADVTATRLCGRSGGPGLGRAAARGGEKGGIWERTWMRTCWSHTGSQHEPCTQTRGAESVRTGQGGRCHPVAAKLQSLVGKMREITLIRIPNLQSAL